MLPIQTIFLIHRKPKLVFLSLTNKEVFHLIKIPFFLLNTALFTVARTWEQSRCPSAEERIRKLWYMYTMNIQFNSVQFSHSVVSDSLWPHGLQHARPPCPSPTPRVYPNSRPLSWWCHPTISSCRPHLLLPSSFPASGSFPMSHFLLSY